MKNLLHSFFIGIIILSCISILTSCSYPTLQCNFHNEYLIQNDFSSPYFHFEQDDCEWHTGRGKIYDHCLNGKYIIKDNMIVCKESYWNLSIELELIENDRIRIVSIKDNDSVLDWLNEGDVLTCFNEIP